MDSKRRSKRNKAYAVSTMVLLFLAVITAIEYFVALSFNGAFILMLLGLIKAVAVLQYFMHVSRLWIEEEGH